MVNSLQEQLLKAGLGDAKKAKQVNKEQRKKKKVARKSGEQVVDETKVAVQQALQEKQERDRKLNQERELERQKKAIAAQIKQLINTNEIDRSKGDIEYSFTDGTKIKKIFVSEKLQLELARGQLAIAKLDESYHLIPKRVAEKIAQRDEEKIVFLSDKKTEQVDEEDPYAAYQIPDDLMW